MIETNTLTETTDSKKIFCENNTKRQEENKATDIPQRDRPNDLRIFQLYHDENKLHLMK
jgi:hypothetical protein